MIKRNELLGMRHIDRQLKSWYYVVQYGDEAKPFEAIIHFNRHQYGGYEYVKVSLVNNGKPVLLGEVYEYTFQMPRGGMPIEVITATGLKQIQMSLMEDAQSLALIVSAMEIATGGM